MAEGISPNKREMLKKIGDRIDDRVVKHREKVFGRSFGQMIDDNFNKKGRVKIQFSPETGDGIWDMINEIKVEWDRVEQENFNNDMQELRDKYPEAKIEGKFKEYSAGAIVHRLLSDEVERIRKL